MEHIYASITLIFLSLIIRFVMQWVGQVWICTIAHTATLVLLPLLTYTITSVIAGNIALSLGMVGALSIVRFRNPVRSPLELSVYFLAITMGISASVDLKWLFFLVGWALIAAALLVIINAIYKNIFSKEFFVTSFAEGNSLSSLHVIVDEEISLLNDNHLLSSKRRTGKKIEYVLVSSDFRTLKNVCDELPNTDRVEYSITK